MNHQTNDNERDLTLWAIETIAQARAAGWVLPCPVCGETTGEGSDIGLQTTTVATGAPFAYAACPPCGAMLRGFFGENVRLRAELMVNAAALEQSEAGAAEAFRALSAAMARGEVTYEDCSACGEHRAAHVQPGPSGAWAFTHWLCQRCEGVQP